MRGPGRRRGRLAPLVLVAVLLAVGAPPAAAVAQELSREQAAALAGAARNGDTAALQRLEQASTIDGLPADTGTALAGVRGEALNQRLATIERELGATSSGDADPAGARAEARDIVSGFDSSGSAPEPPAAPSPGDGSIGFDIGAFWIPLLILAAVGGAFLAIRLARGREAGARLAERQAAAAAAETPSELAERAERAERDGDFETALRLRYGLALGELQDAGAIAPDPSLTPAGLSHRLGSTRARGLVATFERVVYGRRQAGAADVREARDGWREVVAAARPGAGAEDGEQR